MMTAEFMLSKRPDARITASWFFFLKKTNAFSGEINTTDVLLLHSNTYEESDISSTPTLIRTSDVSIHQYDVTISNWNLKCRNENCYLQLNSSVDVSFQLILLRSSYTHQKRLAWALERKKCQNIDKIFGFFSRSCQIRNNVEMVK